MERRGLDTAWCLEFAELHRDVLAIHGRLIGKGILAENEIIALGMFMGMVSQLAIEPRESEESHEPL